MHSFGSNGRGQLSLGHEDDTHVPTPCIVPDAFPSYAPAQIVAGGNHTLVLFDNGKLFVCGDNTHSQCIPLGAGTSSSLSTFCPVFGDEWSLVAAGWSFTIAVTSDGKVFSSGHGGKGELGLGAVENAVMEVIPDFPPAGSKVVSIEAGMAHTVAVLDDGSVYGWGTGRKGQLGMPAVAMVDRPRLMTGIEWAVEWAVCGREFTFLVERVAERTERRRTLLLGGDKYGIRDAVGILLEGGVVDVQASWGGVYILYDDGRLLGYGRNDRGQLPPEDLGAVQRFAVGSEHVVAIVDGKLVAWGWGEHGNCGKSRSEPGGGDVVGVVEEVKVPGGGDIIAVGAGCATSWVLVSTQD